MIHHQLRDRATLCMGGCRKLIISVPKATVDVERGKKPALRGYQN